jgi:opacity protein-like surface antigen
MTKLTTAAIILVLTVAAHASTTVMELTSYCEGYMKTAHNISEHYLTFGEGGACYGFMSAMGQILALDREGGHKQFPEICMPRNVDATDAVGAFLIWVRTHPGNEDASALWGVERAFALAYPCTRHAR